MKLAYFLSAALLAATAMAQDLVALLPDFPCHWNQAQPYNQVVQDEYGLNKPVGCVAVAGASILEYFKWPRESFGPASIIMDVTREIRTEPLDWERLAPTPLDARGRRTAQTVLYNLGMLTQMNYWGNGLSSTTVLSNLQKAFRSNSVGMASAYYVALGEGATEEDFETAIWASLRCGSPVAMSVGKNSAHAVVACGYRRKEDNSGYETYIFSGYGSPLALQTLPNVAGYSFIESVVTGIVAERPEGVTSSYALPVLGTVVDENNNPVHFAKVTLSIGGKVVAETFSDAKGRYGLWGWFGHDMTLSCEGQEFVHEATDARVDVRDGVPYMDVDDLRNAIDANTTNFILPVAERPTIYTDLEEAKTAANNNSKGILCLNSEDPNLKIAFREVEKYTLLYADPRLPAPFPEVDSRPDATAFILDTTGKVTNYTVAKSRSALNTFITNPQNPTLNTINTSTARISAAQNGLDYNITISTVVIVDEDVRLGSLSFGRSVTFSGKGSITWTNLEQRDGASLTLDGSNFRYVVPKKEGTDSYLSKPITVKNGASLYFGAGDVSGYSYTETSGNPITIGPGGILTVVSRDTLTRRLILDGGHIDLGSRDTSGGYGFGTLDLLHTIVEVKGDSSVSALSGIGNAALCIRGNSDENNVVTEFRFSNGARLDCPVLVAKPKLPKDQGTLLLSGDGVAAFGTVEAPTMVSGNVLLEGGTFSGRLTLTNGARLTSSAPITVTGTLTVSGKITIKEPRSGVLIYGTATTDVDESLFEVPDGFALRKVGNDYRLVAAHATAPVIYVDGAIAEVLPNTPERNLLVFTTTDYKEFGIWEDYALYRSSTEGGDWNVKVAAIGNVPEGQSVEAYVQAAGCSYILLGGSVNDIPTFTTPDGVCTDAPYAAEGQYVGRLPLRETLQVETAATGGATATTVTYDVQAQIAGFVAKLRRAEHPFARGRLTLLGGGYGLLTPPPRPNREDYENATAYNAAIKDYYDNVYPAYEASIYSQTNKEDYAAYDGLPGNADDSWRFTAKEGSYTLFALRDRYREFRRKADGAFPNETLFIYDSTAPATTSTDEARQQDGALLWVEGRAGRTQAGPICTSGADVSQFNVGSVSGLYALVITPSGQSGDFSQADSPSVGEMLVLNPQGGALTVFAPTGTDATLTVSATGIPSSNTHTVCAAVAEALIKNPTLTVGQALNQALTDNSRLSTTLTLLGDPTVRVMAWPEPEPLLPEGATLAEETLDALRAVAEQGGLFKDYEVTVTSLNDVERPIAELDDALVCFKGLKPTVKDGKVVVAYDFGVTGLRIEGDTVFVTLSVRGKEQTLTFTEGNDYAIAPQSLDGTQPLAAPPAVTPSAPTDDGTVTLSFPLPEGDSTFLFRATVSRPTP